MSTHKFFLYARKSTDAEDRQIYSIEHQLAELRELACKKNLEIVEEYQESRTAKVPGRPLFNEMIARIKRGEASGILAWSPDRIARNSVDGGVVLDFLDRGCIMEIRCASNTFDNSSASKLLLNFLFGLSKYFTDSLSEGIKRGVRRRTMEGYWARRPPLGYTFDKNTRTVAVDPVRAPLIREMFALYSTDGYTLEELTEIINARGLKGYRNKHHPSKPLARSQYELLLKNPFYTGMLRLNGELYEGKHKSIVPIGLFDACQTVLAQRGKHQGLGRKPFLYRGMFKCGECGYAITMEIQKGHTYLRCTKKNGPCSQGYVREEKMIEQVAAIVEQMTIPDALADEMVALLQTEQKQQDVSLIGERKAATAKVADFDLKLQRLSEAYVDGSFALTEYKQTKEKLLKQKRAWIEKLAFLQKSPQTRLEPVIEFIRGSTKARIVAAGDERIAHRNFLQKTSSNLFLASGRLGWEARGAWKHVVDAGFSGKRVVAAPVRSAISHATLPSLCTDPAPTRTVVDQIKAFFMNNPSVAGAVAQV